MSNPTALLLEDSKTQAQLISRLFKVNGWEVIHCETVREAIDSLKLISFQALFLDVFVGTHNSIKHVPQFKQLAPKAPLILMTAGSSHEALEKTLREARASRADYVLRKPFTESALKSVLDSTIADGKAGQIRKHILVIDDSSTVRNLVCGALEFGGYRTSNADSMESALKNIDIAHVDLVLVDIFMPGMGGLEGIKRIKQAWPKVKIVAMSGGAEIEGSEGDALAAAQRLGADQQIRKPFKPETLVDLIGSILLSDTLID